ncbi:hypothetical protein SUGI_0732250 [Cryptomeria japonica]|uniref:protein SRG1 n=1 Tax=Cryptomeria japonica TaxID=3369 RepID=UPI0024148AA3|nr:protein SRG1 [Cryptomeria japonica]GLJ36462.1 hypothetical protein SUGI_0732250 [Cryptomeria japonica]
MFKAMSITDLSTGKPVSLSVPIVQELALQDPHIVPEKYVASEQDRPSLLLPTCESDSVPVIDMSILHDNPKELEKIALAAQEWGFFQVVNHGIPGSLMERMRSVVKSFFQLPLEEKLKYEMQNNQGYGQAFVASEEQRLDWADILFLFTLPVESRDMKLWPTTPANFRETMQDYAFETKILAEKLLSVLAQGLGIRPSCFVESFGELCAAVRMNYYPPCPRPDLVLGLSPHSDASGITILLQDDKCPWVALQVRKGGEWVSIPSIPDALVINIGDHLEVISNGRYKSVEHRAVTSTNKERTSIATFYNPHNKMEVRPVPELLDDYHPCLYRKTTVFEYAMHYLSDKLEGKKSIDFLKIHENN